MKEPQGRDPTPSPEELADKFKNEPALLFVVQLLGNSIDTLGRSMATRLDKMDSRMADVETGLAGVQSKLGHLEERMEDLEDKDRYSRNAARFGVAPRISEPLVMGIGSINAHPKDGTIFPSLSN